MVAAAQKITLASKTPALQVTALRGQAAPIPTGGYGGWTTVARPHRKALTEWDGINPIELTIALMFDASITGPVEADCLTLEQMAQSPGDRQSPPSVTVTGHVPHADLTYVITNLAWDPVPVVAPDGPRTRHEVTVTLLEQVSPDFVQTAAATARGKVTATSKSYLVKAGDTLLKIAAAQLGDYTRWNDIAALNGIRDPNRLTVGQRLKLP